MNERVLSQNEIDQLFARYSDQPIQDEAAGLLTKEELDTVGEIANICMGTAATTLSEILNNWVKIGYPKTIVCNQDEVFKSFNTPYLIIEVKFKNGLNGFNVLVISEEEVALIADIMMGGKGDIKHPIEITEMEMSASTEAMNQMIGASATAMSELFGIPIDISPPKATMVEDLINATHTPLPTEKPVVVARFEITIGKLIKTTFMQITNVDAAREQANFLLMKAGMYDEPGSKPLNKPVIQVSAAPVSKEMPNLDAALGLPLELTFAVGRTRCTTGDLAKLRVGDEIPLAGQVREVELMVGNIPVARGVVIQDGEISSVKIIQLYLPGLKGE